MKTHTETIVKKAIELGAIQKPKELKSLLDFLRKQKPKTVVEIGTAKGGMFYALCQIADPFATLVSIDLPGGSFGGGYTQKDVRKFRTYKKGNQALHFLMLDSHDEGTLKRLKKILNGKSVDVLVIDGDHSYHGVKRDWELYHPLVANDGVVIFHDILYHPQVPQCQVDKFWNKIKKNYQTEEFVDAGDANWGGIGVLHPGIVLIEPPKEFLEAERLYCEEELLKEFKRGKGYLLDISPIPNKQKHFIGMAERGHPNVDIIHSLEDFPWPLPDNSCHVVVGHYIIQRIKPWLMVKFMDELWRILKPDGQLALSIPYAGSPVFWGDPMTCNGVNESTFFYFDPQYKEVYAYYEPKPWAIEKGSPQWVVGGNLEVLMRPRK